jgi:hypothetical protein
MPRHGTRLAVAAVAALATACGHAGDEPASPPGDLAAAAGQALCIPSDEGQLRAKLQGAIDAEIDWAKDVPQCMGGLRPGGDGVRLIFKGELPGDGPLLIVIGAGPLAAGQTARNVPVNLTVVREGKGRFYATQGDDRCAFDEVRQEPTADPQVYRLTGRGYCTQPARAVGGDGSVLLSRFDVTAVVDFK